jgi:hypothetical protein
MPRRWKPLKKIESTRRSYAEKKELAAKLADAAECGSEEDFVQAVKTFKPNIGKEELETWIMRFRDAAREKRGL